jgi:DNA-binding MarR family transcriptional regulator
MQESGLVKKIQSESDARCFDVSITPTGRRIAEKAVPLQSLEINHCFSEVLTNKQKEALIEISEAIAAHMRENHPINKKVAI